MPHTTRPGSEKNAGEGGREETWAGFSGTEAGSERRHAKHATLVTSHTRVTAVQLSSKLENLPRNFDMA